MSDRVALRLAGEVVYTPEKNGLAVEITLAHVEGKIATVEKFKIPWQQSDFHNTVKFECNQHFQKIAIRMAHALGDKAPTSYLEPARPTAGAQEAGSPPPPAPAPLPDAPRYMGRKKAAAAKSA